MGSAPSPVRLHFRHAAGFRHIPLDDTPASSGIRPGLGRLGLSQGQPRCVAPQN